MLIRKKLLTKPPLNELNKNARLNFSRNKINLVKQWRKVIFSDEKKLNFDGNHVFGKWREEILYFSRIMLQSILLVS